MAKTEVKLPQMGEGIIEATITRWLVDVNDYIEIDQPFVEIATDKVDSEIQAPLSGFLKKRFYHEGETPRVGAIIAIISDEDGSYDSAQESLAGMAVDSELNRKSNSEGVVDEGRLNYSNENSFISPFIRYYARQRGVEYSDLLQIKGSGKNREMTKSDIIDYFKANINKPLYTGIQNLNNHLISKNLVRSDHDILRTETEFYLKEGEELIELDRTRKLIAEHMVKSVQEAPHVTSFVEADVTKMVLWRDSEKAKFKAEFGVNLTFTPIIAFTLIKALKEFPEINASLFQGSKLIKKKYINLGIATALPNGNLIVPVVHGADMMNLPKMALEIADLTLRARINKLKPEEISGGTFTITNLGQVGNVSGTPIINQPESAILAVGAIRKKPWVVKVNENNTIGIRDIMTLSLSYDHRIIDGALGGAFLNRIGQLLEGFSQKNYVLY